MSTTQASVTTKVTKATVISLLTTALGILTYVLSSNPKYALDAALIGYALGDSITFLQGSTLDNKWSYASISVLVTAILTIVGTFVGQLVSSNVISPYIGALVGYAIAEAITLLEGAPPAPAPAPSTTTPSTLTAATLGTVAPPSYVFESPGVYINVMQPMTSGIVVNVPYV